MKKNTYFIIKIFSFILFLALFIFSPPEIFAALGADGGGTDNSGLGCGEGFGAIAKILCQNSTNKNVGTTLNKVIGQVVNFLTIIAGLWFLFQFIIAGFSWLSAGGDKNQTTAARDKITNSLIGLIVVVIAWAVVSIIGTMLGLDIMNPGKVIQTLGL